jgi:hypothetical protein
MSKSTQARRFTNIRQRYCRFEQFTCVEEGLGRRYGDLDKRFGYIVVVVIEGGRGRASHDLGDGSRVMTEPALLVCSREI